MATRKLNLPFVRRNLNSRDDEWFRVYHKLGPEPYMTFGQLVHGAREVVWWCREHAECFPNSTVLDIHHVEMY